MFRDIESIKEIVVPGKEKELVRLFARAENFFKHADRDPEAVLDFQPGGTEFVLWEAVIKYVELTNEQTPPMQAMNLWFQIKHPDLFTFEQYRKQQLQQAQAFARSLGKERFYREFLATRLLKQP